MSIRGGESINNLNAPVLYARSGRFDDRLLLAWQLWGIGTRMEDMSWRGPEQRKDVPLLEEHGGRQIGGAS